MSARHDGRCPTPCPACALVRLIADISMHIIETEVNDPWLQNAAGKVIAWLPTHTFDPRLGKSA